MPHSEECLTDPLADGGWCIGKGCTMGQDDYPELWKMFSEALETEDE